MIRSSKLSLWYLILCASVSATALHAQFVVTFQGPATVSQDPTVSFFDPTTLQPGTTLSVPGAFQFLSLADGSELYLITNNTGPAITVLHPRSRSTIASRHDIGNFPNPLNCAALAPDGSRLVVGENAVHIFDTGSNIDLTPNGIAVGSGAAIVGIAISYDSETAYALATYNGNSYLAAISVPQLAVTNTLNIAGSATALALGPNALLYVSAPNQVLEINPATLSTTPNGAIAVNATPGKLAFTPDGNYAVAANQTFGTQPALVLLNLNDHLIEGTAPFTGLTALEASPLTGLSAVFDGLYVASPATVYTFSSGAQSLFDLQIGTNGGLVLEIPVIPGVTSSAIAAAALSNDLGAPAYVNALGNVVPARNYPQFLFAVSNGTLDPASATGIDNLYRIDPASSLLTQQVPLTLTTPGAVAYFAPTFTNNTPDAALTYGSNQTLMPGGTALPLVVRVLDQNGLPIAGQGVSFTVGSGTATVVPANTVTGLDGYAQTIFTAGSTPADIGAIQVTASVAGVLTPVFTMNVATAPTTPAALTIVSGQGQVVLVNPETGGLGSVAPLTVLATDSNGNPVPNALVTFTLASGFGGLTAPDGSQQTVVVVPTDTTGQASIAFTPVAGAPYRGFFQATVTASVTTAAVDSNNNPITVSQSFDITTMVLDVLYCTTPPCNPPLSPLIAQVVQPALGTVFTGLAGSTLPNPVIVHVYTSGGSAVPNVGVSVNTGSNTKLPNTTCAGSSGGLALTNASGIATCNLVLNGQPGTAPLTVSIPESGAVNSPGATFSGYFTLIVQAGPAADVNILSGNNQVVLSGATLPEAFLVQVTDANKNPIPGIPVTWQVVSGSMKLTNASATTSVTGEATASGSVISPAGSTVKVQVTAGSVSATFTVLVSVPAAAIKVVSGNNQSALINTPFSAPLVVQVQDKSGNPAAFAQVAFTTSALVLFTTNGVQSRGAATVTAGANGQASTTITLAGPIAGTFKVSAISGAGKNPPTATFTLTTLPLGPESPLILNAASFAPNIAPGGLVTFIGANLTPTIQGVVTDPEEMSGYGVSFDGVPAPILALVNQNGVQQINAQVPFEELPGTSDNVTIETPQGSAAYSNITVNSLAPGIFTTGTLTISGPTSSQNYPLAEAMRPDGSYVSASNPAQRGENITFFATGLGQTVPNASTGVPGEPGQIVGGTLYAGVNNQGDAVVSAIYQPNAVGVYAVTIQIPPTTTPGPAQPLGLLMVDLTGTAYSAQPAYLPIQ